MPKLSDRRNRRKVEGPKRGGPGSNMEEKEMTDSQAKQYFFNRIRVQILKAQAGRKLCQDMHLVYRLARFERDRGEAMEAYVSLWEYS